MLLDLLKVQIPDCQNCYNFISCDLTFKSKEQRPMTMVLEENHSNLFKHPFWFEIVSSFNSSTLKIYLCVFVKSSMQKLNLHKINLLKVLKFGWAGLAVSRLWNFVKFYLMFDGRCTGCLPRSSLWVWWQPSLASSQFSSRKLWGKNFQKPFKMLSGKILNWCHNMKLLQCRASI